MSAADDTQARSGTSRAGDVPDVSVVIVSWNTRDLLRGCLTSLYQQTRATLEVFVIDNASSDGSVEMVRREFPAVTLIANADNRGFAAANNQGLRPARGRFVLLLNPDTVVLEGAIDRCLAFMAERPDVACLGCQVWEDERTIQRTCFRFPSLFHDLLSSAHVDRFLPNSRAFGGPWMPWWDRRSAMDVDVVSGMFMLARREVLDRVGFLDEAYFVYGEEADWCYRMSRAGLKRHFWPGAKILHLEGGGKSTSQRSVAMYVQMQRSMLIYFRKNYGRASEVMLRASYIPRMVLRLLGGTAGRAMGKVSGKRICEQSLAALALHAGESVSKHLRPSTTS